MTRLLFGRPLLFAAFVPSLLFLGHQQESIVCAAAELVLTEELFNITITAVHLSEIVYSFLHEEDPANWTANCGFEMDSVRLWTDEPDEAIVARAGNYCYGVFRGSKATVEDWRQNLQLGTERVCGNDDDGDGDTCCNVPRGFNAAYNAPFRNEFEQALRECASQCDETCPIVVVTGHSQGGAIATVAAIVLEDLNPMLITFGGPPSVEKPCKAIDNARTYRYVNSQKWERVSRGFQQKLRHWSADVVYDPVPYAPTLKGHIGHQIMLGEDVTGVAYLGLDVELEFKPWDFSFDSHLLVGNNPDFQVGYLERFQALAATIKEFPVRTTGFLAGMPCTQDKECDSRKCEKESLLSKYKCA
jgi:pimeloyl-ACP methyl ester carboxylesterase